MSAPNGAMPGATCACSCCAGLTSLTPVRIKNRQGLSAVAYRVGTRSLFKWSMLAALSSSGHPSLKGLKSREDDDVSIALLDSWATVADVLTFYQERIANESYLLTATERRSLLELGRLIGYELRPGVAASTYVAFTLETIAGAPRSTTIDAGVKIQSVPGPDEKPQTFETVAAIEARADWTALTPRLGKGQKMRRGLQELHLQGSETRLQPGDGILIVGSEREQDDLGSERWDFRLLDTVEPDPKRERTRVTWLEELGNDEYSIDPTEKGVLVFAMRQRAALFGHNAPEPGILHIDATTYIDTKTGDWLDLKLNPALVDLDTVYPKIIAGSWVVFDSPPYRELAKVTHVTSLSRAKFALSGKVTRIVPDMFEHPEQFAIRSTAVFGESEALHLAEWPIRDPVYGNRIALGQLAPELEPGQPLALRGKRQRLRLTRRAPLDLLLVSATGASKLAPGDVLQVMAPPVVPGAGGTPAPTVPDELMHALASSTARDIIWQLRDRSGFIGTLTAKTDVVALATAEKDDEEISELAFIALSSDAVASDNSLTTLKLHGPLESCYDRETLRINANVAPATHGETVTEVLGAGDASQKHQRFTLKQPPLTHVSAATASGGKSTLEVRVNELLWLEVPSLFERGPRERVYVTRTSDEGKTSVEFGDGVNGARPPTGRDNIHAKYRKGIGLDGIVRAGQLSQLMTQPLGVKGAVNAAAATGAADRESPADARQNAPLTVMTLDRTVSLRDYEDFARAFGGIAKALATWDWDGEARRVVITVAGPHGAEVPEDSDTFKHLVEAMTSAGDPFVTFRVKSYRHATFWLTANVKVDEPTFVRADVHAAVVAALRAQFSFDARSFGQGVALSEVIGGMQGVAGVIAVDVDQLYRSGTSPAPPSRLPSALPSIGADGDLLAAELLTLDPAPLSLGRMP